MRRISPGVYENAQGRRVAPRGGFAPMNQQQKNFMKGAPQGNAMRPGAQMPMGSGSGFAPLNQQQQDFLNNGSQESYMRPGMMPQGGQPPMSLGQNDMSGNWVHDQRANQMMMDRNSGGGAGYPSTMENRGAYGGFESNYFPEARGNMPLAPQGMNPIQGAGPNMGMAQGNFDNYFQEARANSPYQMGQPQRPPMAGPGKIKQVQNPKGLMSAPPQSGLGIARSVANQAAGSGGMTRLSPGVYRDANGRTVRR